MGKRPTTVIEILTLGLFAVFALRWAWTQNAWYEPYTVICGLMLICLEVYRRFATKDGGEQAEPPKDAAASLLEWLLANAPTKDLSETLPKALRLAQILGDKDFEKWILCELTGYSPSTMAAADMVPEYRIIPIRHLDLYNRQLLIEDPDLAFVNQDRFRFGVRELEAYAKKGGMGVAHSPAYINAIKEHMNIDVIKYTFHSASIFGILDSIRSILLDRLHKIEQTRANASGGPDIDGRKRQGIHEPDPKEGEKASDAQTAENLDTIEVQLMKALTERSHLTPSRAASLIGCKPAVAEHRLQRLSRAGLVRWDSFGADGADYHLTFEGSDWLHRHGNLE
jgi:hypothetical protein